MVMNKTTLQPTSKCIQNMLLLVIVTCSPLTLATSAVHDSSKLSLRQDHEGENEFEANVTLQKLVKEKYGVSISEFLDLFSGDTEKEVVHPWVYIKNGLPEWEAKLLVHLINDEIKKSKRELIMTPHTFVDEGKWYIEFTCEAFLKKNDELVCRDTKIAAAKRLLSYTKIEDDNGENTTVTLLWPLFPALNGTQIFCYAKNRENENWKKTYSKTIPIVFQTVIENVSTPDDNGPWVWPNVTVIKYNDTTPVMLTCWGWLYKYNFLSWIQRSGDKGSNITGRLTYVIQRNKYSYLKLELLGVFGPADNGSEIVCTRENGKVYKSTPIILVYDGHTEHLGLWCGLSVVWMVMAILAAACACSLVVVVTTRPRCSNA